MKPDSLKCILASYIRAKRYSSDYDDVDGTQLELQSSDSAESKGDHDDRRRDFLFQFAEEPVPAIEPVFHGLNNEQANIARLIGRRLSDMAYLYEPEDFQANGNQASAIGSKTLQFDQKCMFVSTNCNSISIPVVRKGTSDGSASVAWRTLDRTAFSGVHYYDGRGNISFAPGDREKNIEIEIRKNQGEVDISFKVELLDPAGVTIGSNNPLTVFIVDHAKFNDNEKQVIQSIMNCGPNISISYIKSCLSDRITERTFKAALQYVCSSAVNMQAELACGLELYSVAATPGLRHTLCNVVCNFFNDFPELEDIVGMIS